MTDLTQTVRDIQHEIEMTDVCLGNLLDLLDGDIARINNRKIQLIEEFSARRVALEKLIGGTVPAEAEESTDDAAEKMLNKENADDAK